MSDPRRDDSGIDDAGANRLSDVEAEDQKGDEVEERRPKHGCAWWEHTRRHDRGNGIGGVVKPIEEIKHKRHGDEAEQQTHGGGIHCMLRP